MDKGSPPQGIGVGNIDSLERHRRWNWETGARSRGREQRGHEPRRGRFKTVTVPALQCARGSAVSGDAHLTFHFRYSNYTIVELERMSIESLSARSSIVAILLVEEQAVRVGVTVAAAVQLIQSPRRIKLGRSRVSLPLPTFLWFNFVRRPPHHRLLDSQCRAPDYW
jgi:hypothetical protein